MFLKIVGVLASNVLKTNMIIRIWYNIGLFFLYMNSVFRRS